MKSATHRSKTAQAMANLAARLRRPPHQVPPPEPAPPASIQVLEERIRGLEKRLDELTARVNGLLLAIAGALAVQIALALLKH